MIKTVMTVIFPLLFLFASIVPQSALAESTRPMDVNVRNFPVVQQVKGSVSIESPLSHSKFFKKEGLMVPPARRNEYSELTFAGIVETNGFTSISANVLGEIKSGSFSSGTIGVLLIPDEEPILQSLREANRVPFPIETTVAITSGGSSYFESADTLQNVAFPRYRIFLYNTVNKTVDANIYLYLSN
jgi:hypothetical protein